ncbi:hypothetical protein, partial [Bacillus anthracis]
RYFLLSTYRSLEISILAEYINWVIKMWNIITAYLPDWKVFVQAFILFLIPYTISRFFHWVRMSEKEWEE